MLLLVTLLYSAWQWSITVHKTKSGTHQISKSNKLTLDSKAISCKTDDGPAQIKVKDHQSCFSSPPSPPHVAYSISVLSYIGTKFVGMYLSYYR